LPKLAKHGRNGLVCRTSDHRIRRHRSRPLRHRPHHTPHDRFHAIQQGDEERGGKHLLVLF
jgi:hypothetical protein